MACRCWRYAAALTDEDVAGRTAALRQILTDGFVFEGPVFEAYGLDDFLDQIGLWHPMLPAGTKLRIVGGVQEHHGRLLGRYTYVAPSGEQLASGVVVAERASNGAIARMTGFVDAGAQLPQG